VNAALRKSVSTKKPLRVLRGFKNPSPFAPETGYRYDGLYVCNKAWEEEGTAGYMVCKFAFVRMEGQAKIPVKSGREKEAEKILEAY